MRRSPPKEIDSAGQDSFLDVITNIVGILIILVMVVGMRVRNETVVVEEPPTADPQLALLDQKFNAVQHGIREIAEETARLDQEFAIRSQERELLATQIAAAQQELAKRQTQLDDKAKNDWALQNALSAAQADLARLQRQTAVAASEQAPTIQIESYPTPIGRTVLGKEAHFQLSGGRLAYVPFDELLERAKSDMRRHHFSPEDLPRRTFEVGPLDGFELLLTMRGQLVPNTNQVMFSLEEAEFLPKSTALGEPFAEILAPRSEFLSRLNGYDPKLVTITVWFYPDSFAEFRSLKKQLHSMGFATAGWPLAEGTYISGSPKGKRSAAE